MSLSTDYQHDPDLCAKVARVMGKRGVIISGPWCFTADDADESLGWHPDMGGAQAWEVLAWVRGKYWAYFWSKFGNSFCEISGPCLDPDMDALRIEMARESGPTDAVALCRAVAALGDAEEYEVVLWPPKEAP